MMVSPGVVLITGVAGFLGRHIAREFRSSGWRVVGIDVVAPENAPSGIAYHRLTLPAAAVAHVLAETRPDVCVHCAGRASVVGSLHDPAADFQDSVIATFGLLDALRVSAPRCRTILLSSAAVYGNPASLPVSEDAAIAPLSPYGCHKRQCELVADEFARIFGLPTASVRIFSAYGPGLRRQVVWEICARALSESVLRLHGTGAESRDFIHAADIARAVELLARQAECAGEVYNLATGRETSVAELASLLTTALSVAVPIEFDGVQTPGDPLHWRADISRLQELGFAPVIPLEQGLRSVATWASAELAP